jgi:hypothetical protein
VVSFGKSSAVLFSTIPDLYPMIVKCWPIWLISLRKQILTQRKENEVIWTQTLIDCEKFTVKWDILIDEGHLFISISPSAIELYFINHFLFQTTFNCYPFLWLPVWKTFLRKHLDLPSKFINDFHSPLFIHKFPISGNLNHSPNLLSMTILWLSPHSGKLISWTDLFIHTQEADYVTCELIYLFVYHNVVLFILMSLT